MGPTLTVQHIFVMLSRLYVEDRAREGQVRGSAGPLKFVVCRSFPLYIALRISRTSRGGVNVSCYMTKPDFLL